MCDGTDINCYWISSGKGCKLNNIERCKNICANCILLDKCDTQNTVCRVVALRNPFSLNRKQLNHLFYIGECNYG